MHLSSKPLHKQIHDLDDLWPRSCENCLEGWGHLVARALAINAHGIKGLAAPRFLALRKSHVAQLSKNPKSRPRHEHVDISLFTKKTETDYVDVKKDRRSRFVFRWYVHFATAHSF